MIESSFSWKKYLRFGLLVCLAWLFLTPESRQDGISEVVSMPLESTAKASQVVLELAGETHVDSAKLFSSLFDAKNVARACGELTSSIVEAEALAQRLAEGLTMEIEESSAIVRTDCLSQPILDNLMRRLLDIRSEVCRQEMRGAQRMKLLRLAVEQIARGGNEALAIKADDALEIRRLGDAITHSSIRELALAEDAEGGFARVGALEQQLLDLEEVTIRSRHKIRSPEYQACRSHLKELREQRAELSTKYVDGSVWMRRIDERITAAKTELSMTPEMLLMRSSVKSGEMEAALTLDLLRSKTQLAEVEARLKHQRRRMKSLQLEWQRLLQRIKDGREDGQPVDSILGAFDDIASEEHDFLITIGSRF